MIIAVSCGELLYFFFFFGVGLFVVVLFYSTGCLEINVTHLYDNDLLLRQAQWRSFGTCPVKNASFELDLKSMFF